MKIIQIEHQRNTAITLVEKLAEELRKHKIETTIPTKEFVEFMQIKTDIHKHEEEMGRAPVEKETPKRFRGKNLEGIYHFLKEAGFEICFPYKDFVSYDPRWYKYGSYYDLDELVQVWDGDNKICDVYDQRDEAIKALRELLNNSSVTSSDEDFTDICIVNEFYDKAYEFLKRFPTQEEE